MKRLITPEYISKLVNFSPDLQEEWIFDAKKDDMRNAQAKGASHLYNLLQKNKIALLADEVGMGKTIQALSICAALWREKPEAKILVIAPREVVARNWISEYGQFIRNHYRLNDNKVRSEIGDLPVNEMIYCHSLFALTHNIGLKWPKLLLAKTTSFSALVSYSNVAKSLKSIGINSGDITGTNLEKNEKVCKYIRNKIGVDEPIFDLIIIDEAHYFRNSEAKTLRTDTAKKLFGIPDKDVPLARNVLLMTATPNHSTSGDIKSILSYFSNDYKTLTNDEILKKLCVRRLRRLSDNGITKYGYRKEVELPAEFESDPIGELFFGLYHYELIQKMEKDHVSGKGTNKIRSYLEGTEFIPEETEVLEGEDESENEEETSGQNKKAKEKKSYSEGDDIGIGDDRNMLLNLSKIFYEKFKKPPHHPKYDAMLKEVDGECKNQKAVIFVRRILSVYEINRRMINSLDQQLWMKFRTIKGLEKTEDIPSRDKFKSLLTFIDEDAELIEEESKPENNTQIEGTKKEKQIIEHIKKSDVLDFFVLKKEKINDKIKVDSTPASNFKLRFDPNKPSPFAMFFSPGPSYDEKPYVRLTIQKYISGKKTILNYYESSLHHRLAFYPEWEKVNRHFIKRKKPVIGKEEELNEIIPTFFTIFWSIILANREAHKNIISAYERLTIVEKEALCRFIGEGLLSGSTVIVDLFLIFVELNVANKKNKPDALKDYLTFCSKISPIINSGIVFKKICDSILNFKQIYRKVFNIQSEADLFNEDWNHFNYMNVYPFSAKNKNASILSSFNTPFFPDYLVATSVLQEGVNLQFFCDKLFHYGAAWTPGDNEQRNGRIDRMFGLIERRLNEAGKSDSTLNLYYPYLKNSVDEANLSKFFIKKHICDKLIDEGKGIDEEILNNLEEDPQFNWRGFLRSVPSNEVEEPFKVDMNRFSGISAPEIKLPEESIAIFVESIKSTIQSISDLQIEITSLGENIGNGFVADPFIADGIKNRRQPVIIELLFDSIGSSLMKETVFTLRMKTPLERSMKWKHALKAISDNSIFVPEGIKLCLDSKTGRGNYWGLYLRADLPIFTDRKKGNPISVDEIKDCFKNLVLFSDQLEKSAFQEQDLLKDDLNLSKTISVLNNKENILKGAKGVVERKNWRISNNYSRLNYIIDTAIDLERFNLEKNHEVNYLHYSIGKSGIVINAYLYANDATEIEYDFLERIMSMNLAQAKFELSFWAE